MDIESLSEYDFTLSEELIAKFPAKVRHESKLMVVDIQKNSIHIENEFQQIRKLLKPNDILVYNSTKVSNRRVFLFSSSSREHESIFLEEKNGFWISLVKNSSKLKQGEILTDAQKKYQFEFHRIDQETVGFLGKNFTITEDTFDEIGTIPIPPYLRRKANLEDNERYQTLFAKEKGSVASPTAGLHFSNELKESLIEDGISFVEIVLHIGYGTFSPLTDSQLQTGKLHKEKYFLSPETASILENKKGRVIAIGTTTLRTLESSLVSGNDRFKVGYGETEIFLKPGDQIRSIDGLITNFHLPKSSLLLLVSAFANKELIMNSYRLAVAEKFRFYSYGDAMFLFKK
ncbi:MAG: tRNA preQ1(34) S-adenosylmethionine ribosyltransferase-isomerase QueA [Leptospiraceae bacterium]|nr:tRNA preQ1(34) S-adenosylmethionine ribosyltransferase-isomerase QueA [Leptospiraceae bacterium]